MGKKYVIETQGLTKNFMGFTAVDDVNLKIREGTVHAVIGPNGAGKSTLFNLITKFHQPSAGKITLKGSDITRVRPANLAQKGMVRSFQISAIFPEMTVLENVKVARLRKYGAPSRFWESLGSMNALDEACLALIEDVGLTEYIHHFAGQLPYGRKRALELATTLALEPEVLLLDEPMAGLGQEDIKKISNLIGRVAKGRTVMMVEHNMSVIAQLADVITVLQRGEVLVEGDYDYVSRHPKVLEAYVGTGENKRA